MTFQLENAMGRYRYLGNSFPLVLITLIVLVITGPTAVQGQMYAYPKAGQSPEQQAKDQSECHQWAVQQTGFDPNQMAAQPQAGYAPPPSQPGVFGRGEYGQGGMVGDAGRGAALGAIGGAIAGDAGEGAAIGAVAGALFGGIKRSNRQYEQQQWQQQQQQQMAQQQAQGMQAYQRAFAACMSGRNYQVQ